ncbi:MAG: GNAT family N-acetyltransferase, partial [Tunicatimonas sp.]|uniref:GNAT family N-acetyltransferase n=1 Tax=Tunicatimonas sp. TaxID=1940096 RepID=UPI003C7296E0
SMNITIKETKGIKKKDILSLYEANDWSSAQKPDALYNALMNSDTLISAWDGNILVGIGNAITDGYLVVYYPHLLVLPDYQGKGVGKKIMEVFRERYVNFHQQILVADGQAIDFYQQCGFQTAGETRAMWVYRGNEH